MKTEQKFNIKNASSTVYLITIFSTIIGGWIIFNYITFIKNPFLPEIIISQPLVLIYTAFYTSLIIIIIFFLLFSPHHFTIEIRKLGIYRGKQKSTLDYTYLFSLLFPPIIILSVIIVQYFFKVKNIDTFIQTSLYIGTFFPLLYIALFLFKKTNEHNALFKIRTTKWETPFTTGNTIFIIIAISTIILSNYIIISFMINFSLQWIHQEKEKLYFLMLFLFIMTLNNIISYFHLNKNNYRKGIYSNYKKSFTGIFLIFTLLLLITMTYSNGISKFFLKITNFVEIPRQSKWYLIHNPYINQNKSHQIIGINKNDLTYIKEVFSCDGDKDDKNQCNLYLIEKKNALYGYMAWNLGSTKLFCPYHANFEGNNEERKKDAEKCLLIDSQFLQPISETYFNVELYTKSRERKS